MHCSTKSCSIPVFIIMFEIYSISSCHPVDSVQSPKPTFDPPHQASVGSSSEKVTNLLPNSDSTPLSSTKSTDFVEITSNDKFSTPITQRLSYLSSLFRSIFYKQPSRKLDKKSTVVKKGKRLKVAEKILPQSNFLFKKDKNKGIKMDTNVALHTVNQPDPNTPANIAVM